MKSFLLRNAHRFIGIIILVLILLRLDISQLKSDLCHTKLSYLFVALILMVPINLLKSIRWNLILRFQHIHLSWLDAFLIYWVGIFLGCITPGKLGDLGKIAYITRRGHSLGKSSLSVLLDRLLDISIFVILGYLSSIYLMNLLFKQFVAFTVGLGVLAVIIAVCLWEKGRLLSFFKRISRPFMRSRMVEKIGLTGGDFVREARMLDRAIIAKTVLITMAQMVLVILFYGLLASSLGIGLTLFQLIASISFAVLVSLIPISIFGIGTRDAALVTIFSYFGLPSELAISFSFLILFSLTVTSAIGFVCWLMRPLAMGSIAEQNSS